MKHINQMNSALFHFTVLAFFGLIAGTNPSHSASLTVIEVTCTKPNGGARVLTKQNDEHKLCQIRDTVRFKVGRSNLNAWLADPKNALNDLRLVINDTTIPGSSAKVVDVGDHISFRLQRDLSEDNNKAAWQEALAGIWFLKVGDDAPPTVRFGVAKASDGTRLNLVGENAIRFRVASPLRWITLGVAFLAMVGTLLYLNARTDVLREDGTVDGRKAASLGRTQMAFWFVIIFGSYLYLWAVTGDYNIPNAQVLLLAGISVTTGGVAYTYRVKKEEADGSELKEIAKLEQHVAALEKQSNEEASEEDKKALKAELSRAQAEKKMKQPGFFKDLLISKGKYSFPRFQMVWWTIILGFVFVHGVFTQYVMPSFSLELLGLMGLSSGTYVGFKFREHADG